MAPAPRARVPRGAVVLDSRRPSEAQVVDGETDTEQNGGPRKLSMPEHSDAIRPTTFTLRRRSTGNKAMDALRADDPEMMKHLKHLGPSNAANRPKSTRINTVKIKPAHTASPQPEIPSTIPENSRPASQTVLAQDSHAPEGGIGAGLLSSAAGEASDGVHSLAVGYGTMAAPSGDRMSWKSGKSGTKNTGDEAISPGAQQPSYADVVAEGTEGQNGGQPKARRASQSTIGSLQSRKSRSRSPPKKRHTARSGSISENIIDVNGIKKIVLETTSSSDSDDKLAYSQADGVQDSRQHSEDESAQTVGKGDSKKKRKKRGKKKNKGGNSSESQPLLGKR